MISMMEAFLILCEAAHKAHYSKLCPSALVQSVFLQSASICYSYLGYNIVWFASSKEAYDVQYRVCASVIRSLRFCSCLDRDYELMIETLACD